jgi:acyl carrier protein
MGQTIEATNRERLKSVMLDILLMEPDEFTFDLQRDQAETWDSLAIVAIAVGIQETFGYHLTQDEAMSIRGVQDIIAILRQKGVPIDE